MNTFTKFTRTFLGKNFDNESLNNFWNSIIFYNYVQKPIKSSRRAPSSKMFINSEKAFFEIIEKYNPDIIFVWGNRLWKQLPNDNFSDNKMLMGKPCGFYDNKKRIIPTFYINHPSSGLEYEFWSKYIKKALERIKQ